MLSLLIAAQCERLIVTVPSDSLRGQLSQKFCTLGLLKAFGIVLPTVEQPILGILHERFKTGDEVGRDAIIAWLTRSGYERNDIVWSPGQFVSRGSIVDVFSPSDPFPLRIEFFDDRIALIA